MCGDLEEPDGESERLYGGFLQAAEAAIHEAVDHRGGSRRRIEQQEGDSGDRLSDASLHAYMDGLFADVLSACVKDARRACSPERYRVLASQAVVLARVAGFLAGHLDPREEPLASSIEALMAGYAPRGLVHSHD
ncbi:MAG: hypothetical protein ACYDAE_25545 [Steroidobacteraceae bacterium]|jgi:hypothetical protein